MTLHFHCVYSNKKINHAALQALGIDGITLQYGEWTDDKPGMSHP